MKEVKQILDLLHLERWSDNLISKFVILYVIYQSKVTCFNTNELLLFYFVEHKCS